MRVFTARFLLGALAIATVCVIASPADAGPLRRLFGGRGAAANTAACCPDVGYGYGQVAAYPAAGYGAAMPMPYGQAGYGSVGNAQSGYRYAANPCCPGNTMAYGSGAYYQSGYGGSYGAGQAYGVGGYYQPGQVYGAGGYHQPGHLIPAGGVPMPLPGTGSTGTGDAVPSNVEKAKITDGAFEPPTITIKPGTAVRWTNDGEKPHTVTAVKGDWDSGDIPAGKDFTATFTKTGTFEYYCRYHKNMKGTIVVK